MLKKNEFRLLFLFLVLSVLAGCNDSTGPDDTGEVAGNKYLTVNSEGNAIRFSVDMQEGKYSYTNETTSQTSNGSFTVSANPNLPGVYITSDNHFIVELPDEAVITSLPLGGGGTDIAFGLSAEQNLSTTALTGNYIFLEYSDTGLSGWGGLRANTDGTYTYAEASDPDSITSPFSYFQGDGSGIWAVDPDVPTRIIITEQGMTLYGTVYENEIFVISHGSDKGFTIGLKYPSSPVPATEVAGKYYGIDYLIETDEIGVGYYTLPAVSGAVEYYVEYSGISSVISGMTSGNLVRHNFVNNLFQAADVNSATQDDDTVYFLMLPGEIMLHYVLDNTQDELISYGIAAKIN